MKCSIIIFVTTLITAQCRSFIPLNLDETTQYRTARVHRVANDEPNFSSTESDDSYIQSNLMDLDLIAEDTSIVDKTLEYSEESKPIAVAQKKSGFFDRNTNSKDHDERIAPWLAQLKLILEELSAEGVSRTKRFGSKVNDVKPVPKSVNNLKDLLDSTEELDIYYRDSQEQGKHVKPRNEDQSMGHGKSMEEELKNMRSGAEFLDSMIADVQNQIERIRKYFNKLCRKHHSMPEGEHDHEHSMGVNQPKKLSIL